MTDNNLPFGVNYEAQPPNQQPDPSFPTGPAEGRLGVILAVLGMLTADFVLFGGFNLGFSLAAIACIVCVGIYLLRQGHRLTPYSAALLGLSLVISGSFARSDDGFVKFVMLLFLWVSASLGLCLLAGQNRRSSGGVSSLLDVPSVLFCLGIGRMGSALQGIRAARKQSSRGGKKRGAALAGLAAAIPILAIVIPLLMRSDAAFEGLVGLLPEFDWSEPFVSAVLGLPAAWVLYTVAAALQHSPHRDAPAPAARKLPVVSVNTALGSLCGVYLVYLLSQLAYIFGGFSGILPEGYTLAQYARRGFFEMAWLCAINLTVIALAVGLTRKAGNIARSTRWLCLFVGVVTLFFVCASCAKMLLYIEVFGLTRLRVLTQVILVFLGITTVLVCIWLFLPKFSYMKPVMLVGLALGALVAWTDVDTVVAAYNVNGYLSGQLETVDTAYLQKLGSGAVPYLARLAQEAPDARIAHKAETALKTWLPDTPEDFRGWNYVNQAAAEYLPESPQDTPPDLPPAAEDSETTQIPLYPNSFALSAVAPVNGCVCLEGVDGATGNPVWYLYLTPGELAGPYESEAALRSLFPKDAPLQWMRWEDAEVWNQGRFLSFRGRAVDSNHIQLWLMDTGEAFTYGPFGTLEEYCSLCEKLSLQPPEHWMDWQYYAAG